MSIDNENNIVMSNSAAEEFFGISSVILEKNKLDKFLPFSNPLINLVNQVKEKKISINEYSVQLNTINNKNFKTLDIQITYTDNKEPYLTILLIERDIAVKFNKQYLKMGSTKSIVGLSSMLAHEIKNPLAGITGAAQFLSLSLSAEDREMTDLIVEESKRIVSLLDQVEQFAVKGYGGELIECEPNLKAREKAANDIAKSTGATFLHPSNDIEVILGQGTACKELLEYNDSIEQE